MSTSVSHHVRADSKPPHPRILSLSACVDFDDGAVTIFARDPQQLLRIGDAFYKAARLLARQIDSDARVLGPVLGDVEASA